MRIIKSLTFLFLIVLPLLLSTSCKKKVQGCMDKDADNFNYLAEEDDATCYYSGGVVFYHKLSTAQYMLDHNIPYTKVYVNDSYRGQLSANIHWTYLPSCESEQAVTMGNYGLANEKSKQFTYKIKDNNNIVLTSGTFVLKANNCEAVEVTF